MRHAESAGEASRQIASAVDRPGQSVLWTAPVVHAALQYALERFRMHVPAIDALNVFPVPDGDTGTNMLMTLEAGIRAVQGAQTDTVSSLLEALARGALLGARGNSGVILYQVFAGLSEAHRGRDTMDASRLAAGLRRSAELAYRAVLQPMEGTMLTVLREMAQAATVAAGERQATLAATLAAARDAAIDTVRRTPDMLPILRQAGVVDAGGQGLAVLTDALTAYASGTEPVIPLPDSAALAGRVAEAMHFLDRLEELHGEEAFGYCTNFVLVGHELPVDEFRQRLLEYGTSAVIVGDSSTIKVHVHTERPDRVLGIALEYGELHTVRIDNMSAQTQELVAERQATHQRARPGAVGVVAVASGQGLTRVMEGFGATVVRGGATMNPATEDILAAIERLPQDAVIVLPNDPNIVPVAHQAAQLSRKRVRVVPTRSVQQGIAALAAFNPDDTLEANERTMEDAIEHVRSLAVTRATRDVTVDGVSVERGQFIGVLDERLVTATDDLTEAVTSLLEAADADSYELLSVFTGVDAPAEAIDQVTDTVRMRWPHLEIEVITGGQPHYPLLMTLE